MCSSCCCSNHRWPCHTCDSGVGAIQSASGRTSTSGSRRKACCTVDSCHIQPNQESQAWASPCSSKQALSPPRCSEDENAARCRPERSPCSCAHAARRPCLSDLQCPKQRLSNQNCQSKASSLSHPKQES